MILTRTEFENLQQQNKLRIAFVGMSNIGKSFRAAQIEKLRGFYRHAVDDEIAQQLGCTGITDIAEWMGLPDAPQYATKEQEYLLLEEAAMQNDISTQGNSIIDTTGSVIYLDETLLSELKKTALVVEFRVPPTFIEMMITDFFAHPKPVIWGDIFEQKSDESLNDALRRCYPKLLADRNERYRQLADIALPGSLTRDESVSAESFWQMLLSSLPQ